MQMTLENSQKRATHAKCHKEFCNKSFKMLTIKTE